MSTIMEGFRYRANDSQFPVANNNKDISAEFPIIPIGMLKIWREEENQDD